MMRSQPGTKQRKHEGSVILSPIRLVKFAGIVQGQPNFQQSNELYRSLALTVRPLNDEFVDAEP